MIYLENEKDFEEIIKNDLVLVDFYANWCGPCQLLTKELEELEKEVEKITILKVDVDKFENIARKYKVMSIPDIRIFKDNKIINSSIGYKSKEELKQFLD